MLEFIVLGNIPGTTLEITFKGALILAAVFFGGLIIRSTERKLYEARINLAHKS
jgi:hypothetical protein